MTSYLVFSRAKQPGANSPVRKRATYDYRWVALLHAGFVRLLEPGQRVWVDVFRY